MDIKMLFGIACVLWAFKIFFGIGTPRAPRREDSPETKRALMGQEFRLMMLGLVVLMAMIVVFNSDGHLSRNIESIKTQVLADVQEVNNGRE